MILADPEKMENEQDRNGPGPLGASSIFGTQRKKVI